jgi:polyisoprenyl-teichoic acid--peptidoglycan teichoic acid transferase
MRDMLIGNIREEGGGQYAIKAINSNFSLTIEDYVIDFGHFDKIINPIDGVEMNISDSEVGIANKYIQCRKK